MANSDGNESYFGQQWINQSITHFFSDDFKDTKIGCGCVEEGDAKEDDLNELRDRAMTAPETTDVANTGRDESAPVPQAASLTNQISFSENSLALSQRMSRSLSPSFSFFATHNTSYSSDGSSASHDNGNHITSLDRCGAVTATFPTFQCRADSDSTVQSTNNSSNNLNCKDASRYQPYYHPADFSSQTWLTAISETISIQALAGGATVVLGAVVIIHPLVLVGAATAAATAAGEWRFRCGADFARFSPLLDQTRMEFYCKCSVSIQQYLTFTFRPRTQQPQLLGPQPCGL